MTWTDIAKRIGEEEGKSISRVAVRAVAHRAMNKMRKTLLTDPHIVDWALDKGLEVENK